MVTSAKYKHDNRGGVAGDRLVALAAQEAGAQPHEQNFDDAEVDQPERIADGRDQDEDREAMRAQDMREHVSLQQAREQCGAGSARAQEEEGPRDHALLHVRPPFSRPSPGNRSSKARPVAAQVKRCARARPAAASRSRNAPSPAIACMWLHHGVGVVSAAMQRGVAADLQQRRLLADDHRAAAGHGFERRQAEALVEGGEHQRERVLVERAQFRIGNEADLVHAKGIAQIEIAENARFLCAGEHQRDIGQLRLMEGGDHGPDVLVGGIDANAEEKPAVLQAKPFEHARIGRQRLDVVAAFVADRHGRDLAAVPFADLPAGEFGDRDHQIGALAQARNDELVGGVEIAARNSPAAPRTVASCTTTI